MPLVTVARALRQLAPMCCRRPDILSISVGIAIGGLSHDNGGLRQPLLRTPFRLV